MKSKDTVYTFDRVIHLGITLAVLWGIVWLLGSLSDVLVPFAVALLLAYLINPLVNLIQKKIHNRVSAVLISLFLIVLLFVLAGWLIIPMILTEISNMGSTLTELVSNSDLSAKVGTLLPADLWVAVRDWAGSQGVQDFFRTENFWQVTEKILGKILPGTWNVISGAASILMSLIGLTVIGVYLVFLSLDFQKVQNRWQDLIPAQYQDRIVSFVEEFSIAMNRYFRAQAAVASIVGILFAIGFTIIGLPLGILLGLFIGLLNMVPYLQIVGLIPAIFLAALHALEGGSNIWVMLALTGGVFIVVQAIQDMLLVPRIMGKITGLSPAIILLSLSVWGKLLGFFGLIIALPMTCLVLAYYERYLSKASGHSVRLMEADSNSGGSA